MAGQSGVSQATVAADSVVLAREQKRRFLHGTSRTIATVGRDGALRIGLALLLFASIPAVFFIRPTLEEIALQRASVTAQGTVVDRAIRVGSDDNGTYDNYYLTYRFLAMGTGQLYTREQQTDQSRYAQYPCGAAIPVRYSPSDPTVSRLTGPDFAERARRDILVGGGEALLLVLPLGFLLAAFAAPLRDRRLARQGVVLPARVLTTNIVEEGGTSARTVKVDFDFVTPIGADVRGREAWVVNESARIPRQGEQVAVIYRNDRRFRLL